MKVTLAIIAALCGFLVPHTLVRSKSAKSSRSNGSPATRSQWFNLHRNRRPVHPGLPLRSDGSHPNLLQRIELLRAVSAEYDAEPLFLDFAGSHTFSIPDTNYSIRLTDRIKEVRLTNMCKAEFIHMYRSGVGGEATIVTVPPGSYVDLQFKDQVLIDNRIILIYPEQKV